MRKSAPLFCALLLSLSARRAWIEICLRLTFWLFLPVALRKESVDRNIYLYNFQMFACIVALRKESVDRNIELSPWGGWGAWSLSARRAWIEMSYLSMETLSQVSLSARRAWIEIVDPDKDTLTDDVALRKESVDRNALFALLCNLLHESLSARRAWIEISNHQTVDYSIASLSARRAWIEIFLAGETKNLS